MRVAALGDSISAGDPAYDPDPRARRLLHFGSDPRSQFEYWASRDDPRLQFRNCGVFGETTDQISARLKECARDADALVIQGGINDIAHALTGPPALRHLAVTQATTYIGRMITAGKNLGLKVALANVLPWNNGYPAAAPLIRQLNHNIATTAKLEQVPLLDFNRALASTKNPNLMPTPLTADGDHPSIAGYRKLGAVTAAGLR